MQQRLALSLLSAVFLSLNLILAPVSAKTAGDPKDTIETLHQTLLEVMQNAHKLGFQGRYQRLEPIIRASFDFPRIASIVVGRYWRKLDPASQQEFLRVFSRLSIDTYANRFDDYDGEQFEYVGTHDSKRGRKIVRTKLVKSDGETVQFVYLLQNKDGKWLILNVIADGVSDLSLKRAEYSHIIKDKGFDTLLDKLREKLVLLEKPGTS